MTKLTTKELTDMRAVADDFFPDTCTISIPGSDTKDALGGIVEGTPTIYTNVACRLDPGASGSGQGRKSIVNDAIEAMSQWVLNIPYDQAIAVDATVTHSSKTYHVKALMDTHSYSTIRRAALIRVN